MYVNNNYYNYKPHSFIGPPDGKARQHLILTLLKKNSQGHSLSPTAINKLVYNTDGYSNSDLVALCQVRVIIIIIIIYIHISIDMHICSVNYIIYLFDC